MAAMSDYLAGQIIAHIFRTASFTKPTTLAIALCSSAPVDTDTGALAGKEIANAGSYARQTLNPLDANWAAPSGSPSNDTTSNTPAITFPTATADWGTITYVAICDSATYGGGNLLFYGPLTVSKTVSNGDTFQFAVGQLSLQVDN
jgi:hypothetical protein